MPGSCAGRFHSLSHLILIKPHLIDDVLRLKVSDLPSIIMYVLSADAQIYSQEHQMHLR